MLHFWTFVTQHFNVLEGKRIFPVIAAGSSVGYMLSGVTTTVVAFIATEPLMFVWAIGSLAAAYMSIGLERTLYRPAFVEDEDQFLVQHEVERKRHGVIAMFGRALEHVTGSRLVLALLLLAFVLQVASRVGDYLVAVIFVAATHNHLQELQFLLNNAVLPGGAVLSGVVLLALQPEIVGNVEVLAGVGIVVAIAFIGAAWWLRSQYLDAIYTRLRTHALSLADYQQAVGRPAPEEIAELQ